MVFDRRELTFKEATKPRRITKRTKEKEYLRCHDCAVEVEWSNGMPRHVGETLDGDTQTHKTNPRRCGCIYNSATQIAYYIKRCKKHGG